MTRTESTSGFGGAIDGELLGGFGYGVLATVGMSIPMAAAVATGVSPMPAPVPKAIVAKLFGGGGVPNPALMALAVGAHLGYGGLFGALFVRFGSPVTVGKGLALGAGLWVVMQVAVLPFLGWGAFGTAVTPKIAVATLVLHLVYGGLFGLAASRT